MLPDPPLKVVRDAGIKGPRGVGQDVDVVRSHGGHENRGRKALLLIEARFLATLGMTERIRVKKELEKEIGSGLQL